MQEGAGRWIIKGHTEAFGGIENLPILIAAMISQVHVYVKTIKIDTRNWDVRTYKSIIWGCFLKAFPKIQQMISFLLRFFVFVF